MEKKIAVVGAGVGGLSAAARLAKRGYAVTVFEKLPHCGGRNNIIEDKGFKFDTGPSFVLMPEYFEEVFRDCGTTLSRYLDLRVLDEHYRIFFPDNDRLTVYADAARTKSELERFERDAAQAYEQFLADTGSLYAQVEPMLYKCFMPFDAMRLSTVPLVMSLRPWESYWQVARKYFMSEKLCYAFTFEAMFMGVSPFQAPGFYSMITYADHVKKIRHPMGGMYEIPRALERLGKSLGATYRYQCPVEAVTRRNGSLAVHTAQGVEEFDRVVINADYSYAQESLLKRRLRRYRYSCSVYLLYLGLRGKTQGLAHHNLFFARDLRRNLSDIFVNRRTPLDPSFYIHVPTVTDPSLAPPGKDIAYVLVPVANLDRPRDRFEQFEERLREGVFDTVRARTGDDLRSLTEIEHRFYPGDFVSRYNIACGATFGLAHNLMQSAFFRPANRDTAMPGVYYVGASTQPGGGLPVVIASSKIVADMITKSNF